MEHRLTVMQKEKNFVVVGCSRSLDDQIGMLLIYRGTGGDEGELIF